MFEGDIPTKEQKLIKEFVEHYQDRLIKMWETEQFEVLPEVK